MTDGERWFDFFSSFLKCIVGSCLFVSLVAVCTNAVNKHLKKKAYQNKVNALMPKSETNEAIIAWRVWRLLSNGKNATLLSCVTGEAWQAGAPMSTKETIEIFQTRNGIHAFKEKTLPKNYDYEIPNITHGECLVYGQVALWGKVIEHEDGYRAEHAYPMHVFIPNIKNSTIIAQTIRKDYGCEVTVLENVSVEVEKITYGNHSTR